MNRDSIQELIGAAVAFRDERDWGQFHNPKELAISLCIESSELLQLMQWFKRDELKRVIEEKRGHLRDELADVLWVLLCIANQTGVDLTAALEKNFIKKNVRDGERHKGNEKLK